MNYFSRITLDPANYRARKLLQNISQNAYREHQSLWQLFPDEPTASRDFIYRGDSRHLSRVYYVISARKPVPSDEWAVETRPYQPKLANGERLSFSLRVNPVITRKDESGRTHRHDIVMNHKKEMKYKELPSDKRPGLAALIQEAGVKWLSERKTKCGFDFDEQSIIVERYDQHQAYKQGNKSAIQYSSMDFTGFLEVTDSDLFTKTLMSGVGPAKAFGCGLMLVRRI